MKARITHFVLVYATSCAAVCLLSGCGKGPQQSVMKRASQAPSQAPIAAAIPAEHDHAAYALFREAAEAGNADAQAMVAGMLSEGMGVAENDAAATEWLQKAADQGYAGAQSRLSGK